MNHANNLAARPHGKRRSRRLKRERAPQSNSILQRWSIGAAAVGATLGQVPRPRWLGRAWVPYAFAFVVQLLIAPWVVHDWDGFVLIRTATDFLGGVSPYQVAERAPIHIFLEDSWPPVNTWYAYPPLPLLLIAPFIGIAQWFDPSPWMLRAALKLPLIAGHLFLAHVSGRLVEQLVEGGPAERLARRRLVERLLLFNPFLIFIAAAWGMFDGVMLALLLASLFLLVRGRHMGAGATFGLAALMKIFPLFVAPLFAVYVWRREGTARAARFVGAAVATASAIALPFFLVAPHGFLQQVLLMHLRRGAQGLALVSAPLQVRNINNFLGWDLPLIPQEMVLAAAAPLLVITLLLLYVRFSHVESASQLLVATCVTFVAVLLVNKVVNHQYLVMPVVLLTLLAGIHHGSLRAARVYTWGAFLSVILIGPHFITFVPADLTGGSTLRVEDALAWVAARVDLAPLVIHAIPHVLAVALMVPALVVSVQVAGPELVRAILMLRDQIVRMLPSRAIKPRSIALAILLVLVLAPPAVLSILAAPGALVAPDETPDASLAFARYDLAIHNPQHDPEILDGYWADVHSVRPLDGYYSANVQKVRNDFAVLAEAGVDVVVVAQSTGNRLRLETLASAAQAAGLSVVPALDLAALDHCVDTQRLPPAEVARLVPITDEPRSVELLVQCVETALRPLRDHPATLHISGRPMLWLTNAHAVPNGVAGTIRTAAPNAWLVAGTAAGSLVPTWADRTYVQPPRGPVDEAYLNAARAAPGELLAVFPGADGDARDYEATWDEVDARAPHWVVLPWNLYREETAIEPQVEVDDHLRATATRIRAWKAG